MARSPLVLDASTAILLAKVDLLRHVVSRGEVWMAEGAFGEATRKETDDARLVPELERGGLIRRAGARAGSARIKDDFHLDEGESQSIALAQEKRAICGTDDGPAIRCCKVVGVPFTSAIAILVALAEGGAVRGELALELLSKLERFGRYAPRILEDAARRVRSAAAGGTGDVT